MRSKLTVLALVVILTLLAVAPGTAAPLAGPCVAGASYDPACDVNHDGVINSGLVVNDAGNDGVLVREATNWAGRFIGDVSVSGSCVGCRQANFALNAGDRALQPGDAVSIQAVTPASFDAATHLWQVTPAQPGQAVVGVVAGRAELVADESDA